GSFVAYVKGEEGPGNQPKVMVQDLSGGQPIEVFKGLDITSLCWSPDGSKLALGSEEPGRYGLFVVPRLGGEARHYESLVDYVSWSPDGSRIAGAALQTPKQLHFLDLITGEEKTIGLSGTFDWTKDIDWSPTNGRLLFLTIGSGKSTVWTIKPDG